ncbi:exonuclease VII small subunit [Micromonospora sp. A200]|nr:exonuclease VII small subunit [Micromonospora sp. A200]
MPGEYFTPPPGYDPYQHDGLRHTIEQLGRDGFPPAPYGMPLDQHLRQVHEDQERRDRQMRDRLEQQRAARHMRDEQERPLLTSQNASQPQADISADQSPLTIKQQELLDRLTHEVKRLQERQTQEVLELYEQSIELYERQAQETLQQHERQMREILELLKPELEGSEYGEPSRGGDRGDTQAGAEGSSQSPAAPMNPQAEGSRDTEPSRGADCKDNKAGAEKGSHPPPPHTTPNQIPRGRATVPADAPAPKFTRAPGMTPPSDRVGTRQHGAERPQPNIARPSGDAEHVWREVFDAVRNPSVTGHSPRVGTLVAKARATASAGAHQRSLWWLAYLMIAVTVIVGVLVAVV